MIRTSNRSEGRDVHDRRILEASADLTVKDAAFTAKRDCTVDPWRLSIPTRVTATTTEVAESRRARVIAYLRRPRVLDRRHQAVAQSVRGTDWLCSSTALSSSGRKSKLQIWPPGKGQFGSTRSIHRWKKRQRSRDGAETMQEGVAERTWTRCSSREHPLRKGPLPANAAKASGTGSGRALRSPDLRQNPDAVRTTIRSTTKHGRRLLKPALTRCPAIRNRSSKESRGAANCPAWRQSALV